MAENDPVLEQRVEALEQFSQARVVEQVGELTERVSSLESARETESPFLATKEDIAHLEGLHTATQEQVAAQSELFNTRLAAQSEQFSKDLNAQSELFNTQLAAQSEQFSKDLNAHSELFSTRLEALSERFDNKLEALSERFDSKQETQTQQLRKELEQRVNRQTAFIITTIVACTGVLIYFLQNLPS